MKPKIPPAGELRRSQILTTFGPGSMVDLPNHAVLIAGLEYWRGDKERIFEERLEAWLSKRLGVPELKLFAPPANVGGEVGPQTGIEAFLFPTWFLGQVEDTWKSPDGRVYRTRPLVHWEHLRNGKYFDGNRKSHPVVPVRFVQACVRGHISDVDWYGFVRQDYKTDHNGNLWLDEGGAGNDFAEIYVRDEKNENARRPLSEATVRNAAVLGTCAGLSPWLGPRVREACDKPNRLLTRSASNAYFSQTVNVISLPDGDQALRTAIDRVFEDFLKYSENEADIRKERRKDKVSAALEGFSDAAVWAEVDQRRKGIPKLDKSIKQVEIETLLSQKATLGEDTPEGDFYARTHPVGPLPPIAQNKIDRLVLVHRLREVSAQVGFTRFDATLPDFADGIDLKVELAPLARDLTWLPANENRGEGVFLSFSEAAVEAWLKRKAVTTRGDQLEKGFEVWCQRKHIDPAKFRGPAYIMLHSLAHLMITTLSLDCGYSASAIRERIYAPAAGASGYGILLYTGTPGSEGSLGGLVEMGKNIGRHIARALELGRLCSNDPVCGEHDAADPHEERFLHGAACHGCLLIAETSCERRNEFLDRALVVPTVATPGAAFFSEGE